MGKEPIWGVCFVLGDIWPPKGHGRYPLRPLTKREQALHPWVWIVCPANPKLACGSVCGGCFILQLLHNLCASPTSGVGPRVTFAAQGRGFKSHAQTSFRVWCTPMPAKMTGTVAIGSRCAFLRFGDGVGKRGTSQLNSTHFGGPETLKVVRIDMVLGLEASKMVQNGQIWSWKPTISWCTV